MLTKDERRALQLARDLIWKGRQEFICSALIDVMVDYPHLMLASIRLRCYIDDALQGSGTLYIWQRLHGIRRNATERQLDRMAWIDWMLGE